MKTMDDFTELNKYESEFCLSPTFDFPVHVPARSRFIVLSTPRSGSTLLTSALYESSLAGAPFEYFHSNVLKQAGNPERLPNGLKGYFEGLEKRRTSRNGFFGMKLAHEQFDSLFGGSPISADYGFNFLRGFNKFILIRRRDKIMQSISGFVARHNKVWASTDAGVRSTLRYKLDASDIETISRGVTAYVKSENAWREVLAFLRKDFIEVTYEDISYDFQKEMGRVFRHLEITEDGPPEVEAPTVKTTDAAITLEMKQAYLNAIGAFETP
jgi:LPS sulfotransferase NodH